MRQERAVDDIVALADVQMSDRSCVGGKGWHLGRMARAGLPVPSGLVLTTGAWQRAMAAWDLPLEPTSEQIASQILPDALRRSLSDALTGLAGPFAVRSSAVAEDGEEQSFAGQYATELGVAAGDVAAAVVRCWASAFSASVAAYDGSASKRMAVVVQRMVTPHVSGVLFTVNPLSGSWREMTVEAVYGLCEPLVAGTVTPHWYLVRRPRRAPRLLQRLLSRVRLQVLQQDLPPLATQRVVGPHGPETVGVAVSRQSRPTLTRRALFRVCRMGLRVEALFGAPQDVEWAMDAAGTVFLLQSRPVTRTATPRSRDDVLWTRRFIGERWPMPATPLGWSLMQPVLEHFIAYPRTQQRYLGGGPPLKLVNSRPYVNVTAFRYLTFKLPGAPPPQFMLELVPPEDEAGWQRRFAAMPDVSVYLSYLRETFGEARWQRFAMNPLSNPRQWDRFAERLSSQLSAWTDDPSGPDDAVRRVTAQQEWVVEYVGIHLCSLLFANLLYQLLDGALTEALPEQAASLMTQLAVSPEGNATLQTNHALYQLAQSATAGQLDRLEQGRLPRGRFREELDTFLAEYGHRSMASWELFTPRWARHPELLVPMLRAFQGRTLLDPSLRAHQQEGAFATALTVVLTQTEGHQRGWLHLLIRYTRTYLRLRENQRFVFDRLLWAEQRTLLWLGEWAVGSGTLHAADDIAYLTWPEVQQLASGDLDADAVRDVITARRSRRLADRKIMPPVFLEGESERVQTVSGRRLQGLGISGGRVTGPVAIVRSPADAAAMPDGAILVAHAVDPGWTPLFGAVAGVVLELGSRLSHGAVVAREYGLPAVVNLEGITDVLRNGQSVTVDGTRGIVWVHDDSAQAVGSGSTPSTTKVSR